MSINQKVLDAIEILANSSVAKAGYDRTIQAQILSCEDASIGKYRCRYQDATIYAYSNILNTSYNKGDYVYILIPGGDMKKEKTILCTSNRLGNNFISETKEEDKYDIVGNNVITSTKKYYLNTANSDYSYDIYAADRTDNALELDVAAIEKYLRESDAFKVSMFIKTSIPIQRQSRGSYGLIFTLVFKDNTLEQDVERVYIINEDCMVDNPYRYKNNTKQTAIFKIDGANFVKIKKITLFNNSFPAADDTMVTGSLSNGDIIISALNFCGMAAIDIESVKGVSISFNTPNGTILTSSIDSLPITAQVKVDGKIVSSNQNLKFYWGIEDAGVVPSSMYYNKCLGGGWRCLNECNRITSTTVDWVPNAGTFNYTKDYDNGLLTTDNKIKVAVLFNGTVYINEIVIHNDNKTTNITLTSNSGTVFYYDKGAPKIVCNIIGGNGEYSYKWGQESNTGIFNTIVNDDNKVQINIKQITDFIKVKCSVYKGATYQGTAAITLINSLNQNQLSLIEGWDGKTVQINEDSILSPRVGAGKKDENGFTGVVMGLLKEYPENFSQEIKEKIGLFGYSNSNRSFFLNSENGSAIFGLDEGSIVIDPSATKAMLYSKSFWKKYAENQLPDGYGTENESGAGMLIDLSTPEIRFGSGAFSVDENGILTATNVNVSGTLITSSNPINPIFTSIHLDAGIMSIWYRSAGDAATPAPKVFEMLVAGQDPVIQTGLIVNPASSQGLFLGISQPSKTNPDENEFLADYEYSLGEAERQTGCRHTFIGKIKFYEDQSDRKSPSGNDTTLMEINGNAKIMGSLTADSITIENGSLISGDQSYLGNLTVSGNIVSSNGKVTANNGLDITGTSILRGAATLNSDLTVIGSSSFRNNINILGDKSLQWGNKDFIKYVTLESDASNYGLYVGAIDEHLFLRGSTITSNAAISTSSDMRKKQQIKELDKKYLQLMREISPVSFKYKAGTADKESLHTGFIAQDVQAAMQKCSILSDQFAALVDINKDGSEYALRYEEFISPMLLYIKSLEKQIELLKQKVGI